MSDTLEVVLSVTDPMHYSRLAGDRLPVGIVRAIALPELGTKTVAYEYGKSIVEVALHLPRERAICVFGSFAIHQAHKSGLDAINHRGNCGHNCLTFMAESQGWPVGSAEQFQNSGPRLHEGGYEVMSNLVNLEPGAPYALPDDLNRLTHGFVGTDLADRCLEFDGANSRGGGHMRFRQTTAMVHSRTSSFSRQHHVVLLHTQSYSSTEPSQP